MIINSTVNNIVFDNDDFARFWFPPLSEIINAVGYEGLLEIKILTSKFTDNLHKLLENLEPGLTE